MDDQADIFDLSAAYVFSIAINHPFIDGNKRTAAVTGISFLKINGLTVDFEPSYLAAVVESLVTHSCDKNFVAQFMFLGCVKEIIQIACRRDQGESAPASFIKAKSQEVKDAIVTDYVTSKTRVKLIDLCQKFTIRPDRFDAVLDHTENELFKKVALEWRLQFGMTCEDSGEDHEP